MESTAIVGLGNPGRRYAGTRHNAGFLVLDEVCRRWRVTPRDGDGPYDVAESRFGNPERLVLLVAPMTYMNNSGEAVRDIVDRYHLEPRALLIVLDDFWLPLGTLRFRSKGSDGGHHGLESIIAALGTDEIPRLRLGIGQPTMPPKSMMADFVLSTFEASECEAVAHMITRSADAVEEFAQHGHTTPKNLKADIPPSNDIT